MPPDENKDLIRRYIQAIDDNQTSDWSILDEYLALDFVAHNPAIPGVRSSNTGLSPMSRVSSSRWARCRDRKAEGFAGRRRGL